MCICAGLPLENAAGFTDPHRASSWQIGNWGSQVDYATGIVSAAIRVETCGLAMTGPFKEIT